MFRLTLNQRQGESFNVMLFASAMAISIVAIVSLLGVILVKGTSYFWPANIQLVDRSSNGGVSPLYGQLVSVTNTSDGVDVSKQYRVTDWDSLRSVALFVHTPNPSQQSDIDVQYEKAFPLDVAVLTLRNRSQVLAKPVHLTKLEHVIPLSSFWLLHNDVTQIQTEIESILKNQISSLNERLEVASLAGEQQKYRRLLDEYRKTQRDLSGLKASVARYVMVVQSAAGDKYEIPLRDIESYDYINQYTKWQKFKYSAGAIWQFVSESPKQLYSSGGVFPAIFGTVVMVLVMTIFVTPLGIMVAIYLHEYAAQNRLTTLVRISINNLAGVPSIVYGVFGLSFFVYELGAGIDNWFFADALPAPTFGAPGLFWASLTMAMLTLPVVVVATEEGLRRVPDSLRMGSYALGATQFETIKKTVIPMASPGIMTGVILAIARGAGEVAPLILVGAVKFAPALPIDNEYPYIHFDRQFMHLGVTIFDGAFQGQLTGAGSNMMFAACLFLLLIVLTLNIVALIVRHRLRRQYNALREH